jgi:GAF domain-containing protein
MNLTDKKDATVFRKEDIELAEVTAGILAASLQNLLLFSRLDREAAEFLAGSVTSILADILGEHSGPSDPAAELALQMGAALGFSSQALTRSPGSHAGQQRACAGPEP